MGLPNLLHRLDDRLVCIVDAQEALAARACQLVDKCRVDGSQRRLLSNQLVVQRRGVVVVGITWCSDSNASRFVPVGRRLFGAVVYSNTEKSICQNQAPVATVVCTKQRCQNTHRGEVRAVWGEVEHPGPTVGLSTADVRTLEPLNAFITKDCSWIVQWILDVNAIRRPAPRPQPATAAVNPVHSAPDNQVIKTNNHQHEERRGFMHDSYSSSCQCVAA